MRGVSALVAGAVGCVAPDLLPCGDLLCPAGHVCVAEQRCASPAALTACDGMPDGALCAVPGIDGSCDGGVCVASACGDGVASGREQCDGVPSRTCEDFGFYYGATSCAGSCLHDTSGCSGFCGDGIVQDGDGELCDGSRPVRGCAEVGYDYGHLECTARCGDTAHVDCGYFTPRPVYARAGSYEILDAYRDGELFAVTSTQGATLAIPRATRLDIVIRGVTTTHLGSYGTIAARGADILVHDDRVVSAIQPDGELVPLTPVPQDVGAIMGLAIHPSGEPWVIGDSCTIRKLSAGTWEPVTALDVTGFPTCDVGPREPARRDSAIAIGDSGDVYVIQAARVGNGTSARVVWLGPTGWTVVFDTASFPAFVAEGGRGGRVLAGVESPPVPEFLYELEAGTATGVPGSALTIDAAWLGDSYVEYSQFIGRGRIRDGRRDQTAVPTTSGGRARLLRDRQVLIWSLTRVEELEPVELTTFYPIQPFRFATVADSTMVWWGIGSEVHAYLGNDVANFSAGPIATTDFAPEGVLDVAPTASGTTYVATSAGLRWGTLGQSGWQLDATVLPRQVWVGRQGEVAIAQDNDVLVRDGAGWITRALPAPSCRIRLLAGTALDALYVARDCELGKIWWFDGSQWTVAHDAGSAVLRTAEELGDGTIAFGTPDGLVIGSGMTWTAYAGLAVEDISGTSKDDLWIAGIRTQGLFLGPTLARLTGGDLANVRWSSLVRPGAIAASGHAVVASDGTTANLYLRWSVPD